MRDDRCRSVRFVCRLGLAGPASGHGAGSYHGLRRNLGRCILLGLEVLIVADVVRTMIVDPTIESVAVLGIIVAIRIFLSFALEVEVDGIWPWRRWRLANSRNAKARPTTLWRRAQDGRALSRTPNTVGLRRRPTAARTAPMRVADSALGVGSRCGRIKTRTDRRSPGMLERSFLPDSSSHRCCRLDPGSPRVTPGANTRCGYPPTATKPSHRALVHALTIAARVPPRRATRTRCPSGRLLRSLRSANGTPVRRAMSARPTGCMWRLGSRLCHASGTWSRADRSADNPEEREEKSRSRTSGSPLSRTLSARSDPARHVDNAQQNPEKGDLLHRLETSPGRH